MIGIDLGTTNSVVAISEGTEPVVIANAEGERTTPSVVAFGENGEVLVGEPAKRQAVTDVGRTIRSVKRAMGTDRKIAVDGRAFVPQQISALVLQKLKLDAESHLGEKVTDALITLPAGLSEHQRQAVTEAGRIAGLNVLRVIDEPTSAALAHHARNETDAMILVFDLGGGSCSAAMIEVGDGVVAAKATSGNGHLGGDDWDNAIVDWAVGRFKTAHGIDLAKTRRRWSGCARPARKPRSNCPPPVRRGSPFPTSAVPPGGRCTWTRRSPVPSSRR